MITVGGRVRSQESGLRPYHPVIPTLACPESFFSNPQITLKMKTTLFANGQARKNSVLVPHLTPQSGQDFPGSEWLCSHLPDTRHQTATSGTWPAVSGEESKK